MPVSWLEIHMSGHTKQELGHWLGTQREICRIFGQTLVRFWQLFGTVLPKSPEERDPKKYPVLRQHKSSLNRNLKRILEQI
ncbi:hypothetical protein AUG19_01825 [archaeon 13_1_20CM_2_54_9]|nr:MAG: hypothetical protein AUJ07_07145 [Crenarchaeota archaeon 13_1_40CM_3_53_5]OLE76933.1 MAG: hypothetical protein AUG19_01825 [archaeon 13_1_20CM_2_54_9]